MNYFANESKLYFLNKMLVYNFNEKELKTNNKNLVGYSAESKNISKLIDFINEIKNFTKSVKRFSKISWKNN